MMPDAEHTCMSTSMAPTSQSISLSQVYFPLWMMRQLLEAFTAGLDTGVRLSIQLEAACKAHDGHMKDAEYVIMWELLAFNAVV